MKKVIKIFLVIYFFATIMSGCGTVDSSAIPICRVVTQVDISCRQENMFLQRHYTDSKKMESVLLYLRLLKPLGKPNTDPDSIARETYNITIHFSDGQKRVYRQKAHRYLSIDNHPWRAIDPEQASELYALMGYYPSDSGF